GCGGRGNGAAHDCLSSAQGVKLVALADAFKDRLEGAKNGLKKDFGDKADVKDDHCFVGLDAYKQLIDNADVNYVILATPPGFRPQMIDYAVSKGKNIFTEKPVGVDGPGIRKVLAAYEEAKKKNVAIAAGTQRRHQASYIETI